MSCESKSYQLGPIPVWSKKSNSVWLFFPISEVMDSAKIEAIRVSFSLDASTGDLEVRPALRMSNDGVSWDAPVAIGVATRTADGTTYGSAFVDMSATTKAKQLAQLGIEAKCGSGSALENGMAGLKADIRRL